MLVLDKVFKSFGKNEVLKSLSLEVREGETLVILGPSGTGKSVLLKIIMMLMDSDKGNVYFKGRDISCLPLRERMEVYRHFGMLFQGGALFDSMTVKENVGFTLNQRRELPEEEIDKIVSDKLAMVGMVDVLESMPADLSGGMKKRVGLARAIAHNPQVILYDEPTTGLDPIMANIINRLIIDLKKKLGVTSVVVTHDMSSAFMVADRMAMLHEGSIRTIGTKDEIRNTADPVLVRFMSGEAGET